MPIDGDARPSWLLSLFEVGLAAVNGRVRMRSALVGRDDLRSVWILAVGKAASAMTLGTIDTLGTRVERALVVSRERHFDPALESDPRITCLAGGHPLPTAASLAAGKAALEMAAAAPRGQRILFLVSGGASSLLESLAAGVTPEDLRQVSEWALGSGLDIERVNAVRRRISEVKDGRLLARLSHCRVEGYYLSDVPGDDPAIVGSGLLARERKNLDPAGWPGWIRELVARDPMPAAPSRIERLHCVGRLDDALTAIRRAALAQSVPVTCPAGRLQGDAVVAARQLCDRLTVGAPGLLLLGGETTVVLPDHPGRGGRNQHFALAAAARLAGHGDLFVLAAGTDGSDGNSSDAGALVDGGTLARGGDAGFDAKHCLSRADSGSFLEASGDLVHTGATGTNVGDLVLALRWEADHSPDSPLSM